MAEDVTPTSGDMGRDLAADLELCEAATQGPWVEGDAGIVTARTRMHPLKKDGTPHKRARAVPEVTVVPYLFDFAVLLGRDAAMIAATRTGWPAALRRAIAAEAEVEGLRASLMRLHGEARDGRCCRETLLVLLREILGGREAMERFGPDTDAAAREALRVLRGMSCPTTTALQQP